MDNKENKDFKSTYTRGSRILAMVTLIIIVALIIAMFVCAIIGSKLYLGFLFAAVIVPCLIYAIVWLRGVLNKSYGRKIIGVGEITDENKADDPANNDLTNKNDVSGGSGKAE